MINMYMREIDRQDQMMAYYPCPTKTIRCHRKLEFHFIQIMLINSHQLFHKYPGGLQLTYQDRDNPELVMSELQRLP